MPKACQQPDDEEIEDLSGRAPSIAAEGNIDIFASAYWKNIAIIKRRKWKKHTSIIWKSRMQVRANGRKLLLHATRRQARA